MSKYSKSFFYIKLLILNGVIILFGFGFYNLLGKAIDSQNVAIVGELVPLGVTLLGLGTLEITQIFKYMKHLNMIKQKEQQNV